MLGGQLQDEDIPPGGLEDNFVFPDFEEFQLAQGDNQPPQLQLHPEDNWLPDLNVEPQVQHDEEMQPAEEPQASVDQVLQEEMDIELNLSPPH